MEQQRRSVLLPVFASVVLGALVAVAVMLGVGPKSSSGLPAAGPQPEVAVTDTAPRLNTDPDSPTYTATDGRPRTGFTQLVAPDSRLYNVTFRANSIRCAHTERRSAPVPDAELEPYLTGILDCFVAMHRDAFRRAGLELTTPRLRIFAGSTDSPCGVQDTYAFYCPRDETIYFDRTDDDVLVRGGQLTYHTILAHEFGHHLQRLGGITSDLQSRLSDADPALTEELTRRNELQAMCLSAGILSATWDSWQASDADYVAWLQYLAGDTSEGQATHGATRSRTDWVRAGFNHQWVVYARCNTWVVEPDRVA